MTQNEHEKWIQEVRLKCLDIAEKSCVRFSGGSKSEDVLDKAFKFEQYVLSGDSLFAKSGE